MPDIEVFVTTMAQIQSPFSLTTIDPPQSRAQQGKASKRFSTLPVRRSLANGDDNLTFGGAGTGGVAVEVEVEVPRSRHSRYDALLRGGPAGMGGAVDSDTRQ